MFIPCYEIIIGNKKFGGVNAVTVERVITNLTGTATITVPTTAVENKTDGSKENVLTSQAIKKGDAVSIKLGYNENYVQEFTGYVSRINKKTPLVIECEDNIYLLKQKKIAKSYKNTTLDAVLKDIFDGTNINYSTGGLSLDIKNLILATETGDEVPREAALKEITERYGLVGYFETNGDFFIGLRQGNSTGATKYIIGWNTISENSLKYFEAEEQKYKIKAIYIAPDGKRTEVDAGDEDGSLRTIFLTDVSTTSQMKTLAENELKKYKYDGYSGSFEAFLQPSTNIGNSVTINNAQHSERNGVYYCEGIKTELTTSGGRKTVTIGAKI